MYQDNLLVWLPGPMGDAILSTPALRAIRERYPQAKITYLADKIIREVLEPCVFCDQWLNLEDKNAFKTAKQLKKHNFNQAILFKNSFGSALSVFMAGIKNRVGYNRDGRGFLLTEKLSAPKDYNGKFMPISMIDYYLAIASWLGADINNHSLQLTVDANDYAALKVKLPDIVNSQAPLIVLVPGGAFGPSKCWPSEKFAQTADWLIDNYKAKVIISVAPAEAEKKIARQICDNSANELVDLSARSLSLGELKALYSIANLVICNDTGPRHIAIALGKKVITLFGPNDPAWTQTGHSQEIQIIGKAPCVPCLKPICQQPNHICMESISVEKVCLAAKHLLGSKNPLEISDVRQKFRPISESFFADENYADDLAGLGLTTIESVFSFSGGKNLVKKDLASYRSRIEFEMGTPPKTFFLKRYDKPPLLVQINKWLSRCQRISCGLFDLEPTQRLIACGLGAAKIIAYGQQWAFLFEKRSFLITEKIPNASSLEQKLPDCFYCDKTKQSLIQRRNFIKSLAGFIRLFHKTGLRHRDLYLCHIFYDGKDFALIDLARAFEPLFFSERYRIKDIAQLYYSAEGKHFSKTDRLRFYLSYANTKRLNKQDKKFIAKVISKSLQMAEHDKKHGRIVPFES